MSNSARLIIKALLIVSQELRLQYFDSCEGFKKCMFTQICICETASSQKADQSIIAKFLPNSVGHGFIPFLKETPKLPSNMVYLISRRFYKHKISKDECQGYFLGYHI